MAHHKETFDDYAIDKLTLMHRVDVSDQDKIQLLISGIAQTSLRATALSITADTIDSFLERMRKITQGATEWEKKPPPQNQHGKTKDNTCKNCGKKGHSHKEYRGDVNCFYLIVKKKVTVVSIALC